MHIAGLNCRAGYATGHDAMVSDELSNAFMLEVTRFRTNKSCLYFVNNNASLHNKLFIKFHHAIYR